MSDNDPKEAKPLSREEIAELVDAAIENMAPMSEAEADAVAAKMAELDARMSQEP
jgi:hypothetical protein